VTGTNPSHFKGDNLPVEQLTWDEAKHLCEAIGGRLPTEAELEYAARGQQANALEAWTRLRGTTTTVVFIRTPWE